MPYREQAVGASLWQQTGEGSFGAGILNRY
jgi:hypothetical protein